jgi:hypothetical protein
VAYISDYYKHALASVQGNLSRRGDKYLSGVDTDKIVQYYCDVYELPEIALADNGEPQVIVEAPSSSRKDTQSALVTVRFNVLPEKKVGKVIQRNSSENYVGGTDFSTDSEGFS